MKQPTSSPTFPEFRNIFSTMGRLSDIYFGEKKGKNRKNFGFIRFEGVKNPKELESKLNEAKYRNQILEINIERHGRKAPPQSFPQPKNSGMFRSQPHQNAPEISRTRRMDPRRDGVSYADITRGSNHNHTNYPPPPPCNHLFHHKSYPMFFILTKIWTVTSSLTFWSTPTFKTIISNFGEIVVPFEGITDRVDLSCIKLCILTGIKRKLNDEITARVLEPSLLAPAHSSFKHANPRTNPNMDFRPPPIIQPPPTEIPSAGCVRHLLADRKKSRPRENEISCWSDGDGCLVRPAFQRELKVLDRNQVKPAEEYIRRPCHCRREEIRGLRGRAAKSEIEMWQKRVARAADDLTSCVQRWYVFPARDRAAGDAFFGEKKGLPE
ncbi:hypothetical protein LXL04_020569 [Taraxacum kok-saghyz]